MNEYIQPIIEAISMRDVFDRYGIDVDRAGFAHCPFHSGDRTASLKVYEKNYYCFGCGEHGDVINITRKLFSCNYSAAIAKLNEDFNLGLPVGRKSTLREQQIYSKKYKEFMAQKKAEQEEAQKQEDYVSRLWDEWCFCDRVKREANPISAAYEHACKRIDYVAYLIDSIQIGGESDCHPNTLNTF